MSKAVDLNSPAVQSYLTILQGVISRMATNSFLYKGWAITIAAALSGFAAVNSKHGLLIIALVATLMFWALDGYYLWLERCFVSLYNTVAAKDENAIDFSIPSMLLSFQKYRPFRYRV